MPPPELAERRSDARQLSPLVPGAGAIEGLDDASLPGMTILAPPGTIERRYVLAHALRTVKAGGQIVVLAPRDKGGARLRRELEGFGCRVAEDARRHHRICRTTRPRDPVGLAAAIDAGAPRRVPALGMWSQPGVFSWDRLDPGTALLLETLPALDGAGADLGCGIGVLARAALASPTVTRLALVDIDRRAVEAARRNIADPRAAFVHADVRTPAAAQSGLDFVIMNPPFHDAGREDRALGQAFIAAAAAMLAKGGVCRMVANVALPYEQALIAHFPRVALVARARGYKVYEAGR
ncbi:MAG: methyltransferase [Caulobacteraceae bacterium]